MKKKWTKEEFIEETRKIMGGNDPWLQTKQDVRRQRLRKVVKQRRLRRAKP